MSINFRFFTNSTSVLSKLSIDNSYAGTLGAQNEEDELPNILKCYQGYRVYIRDDREAAMTFTGQKVYAFIRYGSEQKTEKATIYLKDDMNTVDKIVIKKQAIDLTSLIGSLGFPKHSFKILATRYDRPFKNTDIKVCPICGGVTIDGICDECKRKVLNEYDQYSRFLSYGFKPTTLLFNKPFERDKKLHMGFELEMDQTNDESLSQSEAVRFIHNKINTTTEPLIYCKSDGSLTAGVEMVSHPKTLDYFMNNKDKLAELYNDLKDQGWRSESGGHCGLHVHIDKKFLGKDVKYTCAKIAYIYSLFWDEMVAISRRRKDGLGYCTKGDIETTDPLGEVISKISDRGRNRYVAVNNLPTNTIEIRLWRGTLNCDTVMATLDLTQAVVLCAKKYSLNTLQKMSFGDILKFISYPENKTLIEERLIKKGLKDSLKTNDFIKGGK